MLHVKFILVRHFTTLSQVLVHHHHSVFCLTTGPKLPPKRCLHRVRSRASSFKWEYPLLSLRSSSSFLCLLPRLLVISISPFILCMCYVMTRNKQDGSKKLEECLKAAFNFLYSIIVHLLMLQIIRNFKINTVVVNEFKLYRAVVEGAVQLTFFGLLIPCYFAGWHRRMGRTHCFHFVRLANLCPCRIWSD